MSKTKYKILWLDDFFASIQDDYREDLKESIQIFLDDISDANDEGLSVKGVSSYEEFEAELPNINSYHGVVFDLRGMTKGGEVTDQAVHDALVLLRGSNKDIPMYIYSSNSEMEKFELTINDIKSQGRAFPKGFGVDDLIRKIVLDMNSLYNFYIGHEECINLFNDGFLDHNLKPAMDEIVKRYSNSSISHDTYNSMRQILENMLQNLNELGIVKIDSESKDSFNQRVHYLCDFCNPKRDINNNILKDAEGKVQYNFNSPLVPYEICNRETKYLVKFLADMTNLKSHYIPINSDLYLGTYFYRNVLQATYSAFFAVMKWYYSFRQNQQFA